MLEHSKAKLPPDDPDLLTSGNNLATTYDAIGRTSDAIELFEHVLLLRKLVLGPENPDTLNTMSNLARACQTAGRRDDAIRLYEAVLKGRTKALGRDTGKRLPPGPTSLSPTWRRSVMPTLKACSAKTCRSAQRTKSDLWVRFHTMSLLGSALLGRAQYVEAESYLIDGYQGLKASDAKIPASRKKDVAAAAARIAQLYEAWGRDDRAAEWRRQADARRALSFDPILET